MARSQFDCSIKGKSINEILAIFEQSMKQENYEKKIVKDEEIWCKGDGVLVVMQCFNLFFKENSVVIEAWIHDAVLGESELTGLRAVFLKKKMRALAEKLILLFHSEKTEKWKCPECCRDNSAYALTCKCEYQRKLP